VKPLERRHLATHGGHQVAQKLRTTTFRAETEVYLPARERGQAQTGHLAALLQRVALVPGHADVAEGHGHHDRHDPDRP